MPECECGCGKIVAKRFAQGHNRRGATMSEEAKQKISAATAGARNPNYGKKLSDEGRLKLSIAHLGQSDGPKNTNWNGGRYRDSRTGYVYVWIPDDHPFADMRIRGRPYIFEHRLVMASHLGRALRREEVVHHKLPCEGGSGRKYDNRIENLRLFGSHAAHMSFHKSVQPVEEKHAIALRAGVASGKSRGKKKLHQASPSADTMSSPTVSVPSVE